MGSSNPFSFSMLISLLLINYCMVHMCITIYPSYHIILRRIVTHIDDHIYYPKSYSHMLNYFTLGVANP